MSRATGEFQQASGSGAQKRRSSGSEKRKRARPRSIRFTPEEDSRIAEMEAATGLAFAALVRHALFNTPPPRQSHRASIRHEAPARLLAELGKIGGNINQIAHHLNAGRPLYRVQNNIDAALRDLAELRMACLQALGQEPGRYDAD
jgi:hypothetical protein